ncbi:MAG: DUF2141 domain-containing protein [Blastocatellia bacterium]|nr:DUF2141 domain-containing protein [Blastocatellia bacterium]
MLQITKVFIILLSGLSIINFQPIKFINRTSASTLLTVKATGFRNNKGKAGFALYNSQKSYDKDEPFKEQSATIDNNSSTVTFQNISPGTYVAAVFHDENNNGKLDENMLGIPTEGIGLSNNPKISITDIPTFDKTKFSLTKDKLVIELNLQY